MEIKNGKRPLSTKPQQRAVTLDDIFGNTLAVSDDIKAALAKKGFAYRWINYTKYVEMGNSHERAWRPVKRSECGIVDVSLDGNGPDGYIRRGDAVLAVRPIELNEKHKQYLKNEAHRATVGLNKRHAEELRKQAEAAGVGIKITEGYDNE